MRKVILAIVFIIAALLASFYFLGRTDASVLQVQVFVKGDIIDSTTGNKTSFNASIEDLAAHLEPVRKISEPKGNFLELPGVTVLIIQNKTIIGDWTSVAYNGPGVYNVTVGLTRYPKPGDTVSVVARVIDKNSQEVDTVQKDITLT